MANFMFIGNGCFNNSDNWFKLHGATSTYKECEIKGFYHTVKFLIWERTFIACELCGNKHNDTGWKLFFK